MVKTLYRYEKRCSHFNDRLSLELVKCPVLRPTPCGVWVDYYGKEKWVSLSGVKRFAYPDKKSALKNFIRRKERYLRILDSRTEVTIDVLAIARKKFQKDFKIRQTESS